MLLDSATADQDGTAPLIAFDRVAFNYPRSRGASAAPILSDFTLQIRDGEFFCLLGPSGCGKTTVLRLIAGFEFPAGGVIQLEGRPIDGPGAERGVVFQGDDALFDWLTALDNVAFGLRMARVAGPERKARAEQFLELVGLTDQGSKYPSELSGGMKQRIQIARVLVNDPKVLLMDEPFAAVDAQTRTTLQDELVRIWTSTQKTVLFITHDIAEAILLADRIGVMKAGPGSGLYDVIPVRLPRPRSRADQEFGKLYEQISDLIAAQVAQHGKPGAQ